VHSNNKPDVNTENLAKFNAGSIRILGSCYSLTLGLNMEAANTAIFESYQGSATAAKQRRGRLNRLSTDEEATIYIIKIAGTQGEEWFNKIVNHDEIAETIDSKLILNQTWKPTHISKSN